MVIPALVKYRAHAAAEVGEPADDLLHVFLKIERTVAVGAVREYLGANMRKKTKNISKKNSSKN